MNMDLSEIADLDRLIEHLENVSKSLEQLYLNIDDHDRTTAAIIIATNAGLVKGVVQRLNELKG